MTLSGHIENGRIVLDDAIPLVDGMRVRVELLSDRADADHRLEKADESPATFYERHKAWIGSVKDAPADYARNHDHYLHGHPKK